MPKTLAKFVKSLLMNCGETTTIFKFQENVKKIDEKYERAISDVAKGVNENLKTSIISKGQVNGNQADLTCLGTFANCFVKIDKKRLEDLGMLGYAKCFRKTTANPNYEKNRDENRAIFTFLALVELLLSPKCESNSEKCPLKNNDDKKALIRYLHKNFFNPIAGDKEKIFLEEECIELLEEIRLDSFLDDDLDSQIKKITEVRETCTKIEQIDTDFKAAIKKAPACLDSLGVCYKGEP